MPIGSIISQPESNGLKAAYRPVVILVSATNTDNTAKPPVVHCDIYFNDVYYKTISKTQYKTLNLANTEWQFDIQDAAQEYLKKFLGANGEPAIIEATPIIIRTFCRFRSSGTNADGFITAENTAPVQGTSEEDPVSGTGYESNTFFILNATLQHEDSQDLFTHLASLKKRTWATNTLPVTHRPSNYNSCLEDSDVFPIVHEGNDLSCILLYYKFKGQSTYNTALNCQATACPLPTGLEFFVIDNGDDTQTFTINWDPILGATTQLDIQSRPANSTDEWTPHVGSIIPTRQITLPIGLYDFRVQGVGDCISTPSAEYEDKGVVACEPVAILNEPSTLPDGQVGVPYSISLSFSGTAPIALANIIKPAWMTIAVLGMTVNITGTPTAELNDEPVSFDVTNCSGTESITISKEIDVIDPPLSTITNNSTESFMAIVKINGDFYFQDTLNVGETKQFSAPELALGQGVELIVYTTTHIIFTISAVSNSVNIPMNITSNQAVNNSSFAIVDGMQITIT